MIAFTCPRCSQPLTVPDESAEKAVRCDRCLEPVQVPTATPATTLTAPPKGPPSPSPQQAPSLPSTGPIPDAHSTRLSEGALGGHGISTVVRDSGSSARVVVPGYEILEELGRGGMGVVYKARQKSLNRVVALKMILSGAHAGEAELARFKAEAEAIAHLKHPNIVQVYEVGEYDGLPFFSLEFIDGGSLAGRLKAGPLEPVAAARTVETLARAMHAAHQRGVVHRDLKPANVLLSEDGTPKVTDFGLAKKLEAAGQTASGAVMGTPSYMPPEQAAGKTHEIGPAADVYALGATLYDLLTGQPPFLARTPMEVLVHVLTREPGSPRRLQPKVPRDLETICLKCLQKEAGQRYTTALALAEDLEKFLKGEPIKARPTGKVERLLKWGRRHPTRALVCGLLILVMLLGSAGGGVTWLWQGAEQAREQAEAARQDALRSRDQLAQEKRQTEAALERETRAKEGEARAREQLGQVLYLYLVSRAYAEWRDGKMARAEQLLGDCPPALRGWEWYHVKGLCLSTVPLKAHTAPVTCVAFSPDGGWIASGSGILRKKEISKDGDVQTECVGGEGKVWDATTGQQLFTLTGHTSWLTGVAFSPDGKRLATASEDRTVKVWDAETGREALTLKGHTDRVTSVCFSPDGQRLASGGGDSTVKVWDARTGREALSLKGHTGSVTGVAFSPDGKRLASAADDRTVRVWDAGTGLAVLTFKGHTDSVTGVAFSPDGGRLASSSSDRTVRVWEAGTGQEVLTLKGHSGRVTGVAFSPDGRRLASAAEDQTVRLWDARTGQVEQPPGNVSAVSRNVAFSPDGKCLAAASSDGTVRFFDTRLGEAAWDLQGHTGLVTGVAFSPDSRWLASTSWDATTRLWDEVGRERRAFKGQTFITAVAFSPDGRQIATASGTGTVRLMGQKDVTLTGHTGWVTGVAFSPDGTRLASSSWDRTVRIWDSSTGREMHLLKGHAGHVTGVAFSPDGRRLASSSSDRTVRVWDAGTGQEVLTLKGHSDRVTGVAFSPDGRRLASASHDWTVKVWDAGTGREALTLKGHSDRVTGVAFSPDGRRLASASHDRTVKVWDAGTGREALTLKGHSDRVTGVAFSPDGRRLASTSSDRTVKVWGAATTDGNPHQTAAVPFATAGTEFDPVWEPPGK